jgi:hypothetical protein
MRLMRASGNNFASTVLDLLRAGPGVADRRVFAFRVGTNRRHFFDVVANVAAKFLLDAMIGQRDAAIRAFAT